MANQTPAQIDQEFARNQRRIAITSERMMTRALRGKISGLGLHLSGKKKSIALSFSESNFTRSKNNRDRNGQRWRQPDTFNMLYIKMEKHGFVHHYGADTLRKVSRKRHEKNSDARPSQFTLRKKPFIVQAIHASGVIPYVVQELGQSEADYILKNLKYTLDRYDV